MKQIAMKMTYETRHITNSKRSEVTKDLVIVVPSTTVFIIVVLGIAVPSIVVLGAVTTKYSSNW